MRDRVRIGLAVESATDPGSKNSRRLMFKISALLLGFLALGQGKHPNSPVLRSYVPSDAHSYVLPGNESYELWADFQLVQKANDGDPVAEHELGIRYISGKGFSADTEKAAYWIGKAAAQNLPSARYNQAILETNGWGMPWDPFKAYGDIRFAAEREMPEAVYVLGLYLLDNLVVPRDEKEAYCLIRAAADSGYAPAAETVGALDRRGFGMREADTARRFQASSVVFLDFNRDTSTHTDDTTLVGEFLRDGSEKIAGRRTEDAAPDTSLLSQMEEAAESGSPEALTLLGRWHEEGLRFRPDPVRASVYYLRAIRYDSPRAPFLLWDLIHAPNFFATLKSRIDRNDPDAEFIWASLVGSQFDFQLTGAQALELLEKAASRNSVQAIIELGLWYAQGRGVSQNRDRAIALWKRAAALGSREARIRIAVTQIMSAGNPQSARGLVPELRDAARDGSVLAEVALGYCFEKGIGLPRKTGEAARLYRSSAQRGSIVGFSALKRLHEERRPRDFPPVD